MKKKKRITFIDSYMAVRKSWSLNPATRVQKNKKAEMKKKTCRSRNYTYAKSMKSSE